MRLFRALAAKGGFGRSSPTPALGKEITSVTEVESGVIGGSAGRLRVYSRGRPRLERPPRRCGTYQTFELPRRLGDSS